MMRGGRMGGGGMMGGGWDPASYVASLKTELGITAAQEPTWKAYAEQVTSAGETMQSMHQTVFESMGTATWQERQEMMNSMFEARQEVAKMVHEAALALLPHLDAAQKAKAEQSLPGLTYGRGMMRRR